VPVVATLHDLDKEALVDILTKPKNALVKQYQRLFEMEGVELEFTEGALEAVAEKAIARGAGARGLRSIMENVLLEPMFELPGFEEVERLTVNREVIEGTGQPVFTYRDSQKQSQGGG
jgi:ATP-dependent Clp protease ATP-binding subunit ClpX